MVLIFLSCALMRSFSDTRTHSGGCAHGTEKKTRFRHGLCVVHTFTVLKNIFKLVVAATGLGLAIRSIYLKRAYSFTDIPQTAPDLFYISTIIAMGMRFYRI